MKDEFKKSFLNDIKKIKDDAIRDMIHQVILSVENAETLQDISGLKKLKGAKKGIYYRIKVDKYRIGVTIENETVTFVTFDARKDIYKYFP
jgi:mRNA interferase RelE/StbE